MYQRIEPAAGTYLDAPDVLDDGEDGCLVALAAHVFCDGQVQSFAELWRVTGHCPPARIRATGPLSGLIDVRIVRAAHGEPVLVAWCMSAPGRSLVVVLDTATGRRTVLDGLAQPHVAPFEDDGLIVVARKDETIVATVIRNGSSMGQIAISGSGRRVFGPCVAPTGDGVLVAWEEEKGPGSAVWCRYVDNALVPGDSLRLDTGDLTAHAPSVARYRDATLVAWHAPASFAEPQVIVKDTRLVLVRCGEVHEPVAGRGPDPGEEPSGEDQGYEFPVAVGSSDGCVQVLCRSSHGFHRRVLGKRGWSAPQRLDEEGWGCRGPSIRAVEDGKGGAWVVTRERGAVVTRRLRQPDPAVAGPAAFAPRSGVCTGPDAWCTQDRKLDRIDADGMLTWFGDIHQHSAVSDGTGAPHEIYLRARDLYGDDLVALTDHESFLGKRTPPGEWAHLQDLAIRFEQPGRFATLLAYEWTGRMIPGPGHKNVYHDEPGAPLMSRDDPGADTGAGLLARIAMHGGIAIPHHVGWTGADEESHVEALQPCFEVVSCHGSYEAREDRLIGRRGPDRGPFLKELLASGMRFGFTGGSDGHGLLWQHGVSRKRDAHRTGLVAVIAATLDRHAVMEAIKARRVYATTGEKIWLRLWVEGRPMGSVVDAGRGSMVRVKVQVEAGGPLAAVSLVTAGSEIPLDVAGDRVDWEIDLDLAPDAARFLYVRVVRSDGECAMSSPVFLT